MTKISIITICLNNLNGLKKTIESVLMQDYEDVEYIIVDGGSTDGTVDYVCEMAKKYKYITLLHGKDDGRSDAFNKGTRLATGDIVIYLNSGDIIKATDVLSDAAKTWEEHRVDVLGYSVECDTGLIMYANDETWHTGLFPHQGLFIRRDVFDRVGLYNKFLVNRMDYDLFLRFVNEGCSHFFVDRCIVKFDTTGVSSMNLRNGKIEGLGLELIYHKEISEKQAREFCELYSYSRENFKSGELENKKYESEIAMSKRYIILRTILNGMYDGHNFTDYLKSQEINSVIIYGMGDIGRVLVKMMKYHGIDVKYCIDRDQNKKNVDTRIIRLEDANDGADAIIVSNTMHTNEIVEEIQKKIKCRVFCIEDLIKNIC